MERANDRNIEINLKEDKTIRKIILNNEREGINLFIQHIEKITSTMGEFSCLNPGCHLPGETFCGRCISKRCLNYYFQESWEDDDNHQGFSYLSYSNSGMIISGRCCCIITKYINEEDIEFNLCGKSSIDGVGICTSHIKTTEAKKLLSNDIVLDNNTKCRVTSTKECLNPVAGISNFCYYHLTKNIKHIKKINTLKRKIEFINKSIDEDGPEIATTINKGLEKKCAGILTEDNKECTNNCVLGEMYCNIHLKKYNKDNLDKTKSGSLGIVKKRCFNNKSLDKFKCNSVFENRGVKCQNFHIFGSKKCLDCINSETKRKKSISLLKSSIEPSTILIFAI